jgi:HK97 family phage major capsid protein
LLNTIELRKKKASLIKKAEDLVANAEKFSRNLNATEQEQFDSFMNEAKGLGQTIEEEETRQQVEFQNLVVDGKPVSARTFGKENLPELRSHLSGSAVRYGDTTFGAWIQGILTGKMSNVEPEYRQMTVAGDGGYLVPQPLWAEIFTAAMGKARVIEAGARVLRMEAMTLRAPKIIGYPASEWLAELEQATPSSFTFDKEDIIAKKCSIQADMSVELYEDSPLFAGEIESHLSKAIASAVDRAALLGAVGGPIGLVNQEGIQVIASVGTLDSYAPFSQAWGAIEGANYSPTALLMHPWGFATLDALVAGTDGQPLQPPRSWATYKQLPTTQLDLTPSNEHVSTAAILADWRRLLWAVRTDARLELSREADDAWRTYGVKLRIYFRGNCVAIHPQAFCVLSDIELPALPEEQGS